MNSKFKRLITENDHKQLIGYESLGPAAKLSIPTPEHYLPMLYVLGLKNDKDNVSFFSDRTVMGSVSMTSFHLSEG
jgi:4,5-DOPA dioxygenase extradiol